MVDTKPIKCSNLKLDEIMEKIKNTIKEIDISEKDILKLENDLKEYIKILEGYYPKATKTKRRCIECTYTESKSKSDQSKGSEDFIIEIQVIEKAQF